MILFGNLICLATQLVYMKLNKMDELASCFVALLQIYFYKNKYKTIALCLQSLIQKKEDNLELKST